MKTNYFFLAGVFALLLLLPPSTALCQSNSISPQDFGPSAERIGFDSLVMGTPLTFHFTMQGIYFYSNDNAQTAVVDAVAMGGARPHSEPFAVTTTSKGDKSVPLEIFFSSPKKKVGMYFGHVDVAIQAVLSAYDAEGKMLDKVPVTAPAGSARNVSVFIGLGIPETRIHRVTLDYEGTQAPKTIDDLMVEPRQEGAPVDTFKTILFSPASDQQAKIDAINALQARPSREASLTLLEAARNDSDLYIRERAIMALVQLRDPEAIPTLVEIGLKPPNDAVRLAAYNAVWALRQMFPVAAPPKVTITATSPIRLGEEFSVEAKIVSSVDWNFARIRFGVGDLLLQVKTDDTIVYKGKLSAGKPVVMHARFLAQRIGRTTLPLTVNMSSNQVDATSYRAILYIEIQENNGSASMTPFPGWDRVIRHVIPDKEE